MLALTVLINDIQMAKSDAKQFTDASPQGMLNMQTFGKRGHTFRKVIKGWEVYVPELW